MLKSTFYSLNKFFFISNNLAKKIKKSNTLEENSIAGQF